VKTKSVGRQLVKRNYRTGALLVMALTRRIDQSAKWLERD